MPGDGRNKNAGGPSETVKNLSSGIQEIADGLVDKFSRYVDGLSEDGVDRKSVRTDKERQDYRDFMQRIKEKIIAQQTALRELTSAPLAYAVVDSVNREHVSRIANIDSLNEAGTMRRRPRASTSISRITRNISCGKGLLSRSANSCPVSEASSFSKIKR